MKFVDESGNEIECTPEEYIQLKQLSTGKKERKVEREYKQPERDVRPIMSTYKQQEQRVKKFDKFLNPNLPLTNNGYDWNKIAELAFKLMRDDKVKNILDLTTQLGVANGGHNARQLDKALKEKYNITLDVIKGVRGKARSSEGQQFYKRTSKYNWVELTQNAKFLIKTNGAVNIKDLFKKLSLPNTPKNKAKLDMLLKKGYDISLSSIKHRHTPGQRKNLSPEVRDKMSRRMKFIHTHIKYLTRLTPTMPYEEAFRRASFKWKEEYEAKYKFDKKKDIQERANSLVKDIDEEQKVKEREESKSVVDEVKEKVRNEKIVFVEEFPYIFPVKQESMNELKNLIHHMIGNNGRIKYFDVKGVAQINPEVAIEWNGRLFHEFVIEFLRKSKIIADYFNVPNKFKHILDNGYDCIVYHGNADIKSIM